MLLLSAVCGLTSHCTDGPKLQNGWLYPRTLLKSRSQRTEFTSCNCIKMHFKCSFSSAEFAAADFFFLLLSLPVLRSASSAFKALAARMELIFNKADRLDSNAVVRAFISYLGLDFEKQERMIMKCSPIGSNINAELGQRKPSEKELKKYINLI